jgi:hypothetical protein
MKRIVEMNKLVFFIVAYFISFAAWAGDGLSTMLNKVTLQLKAEQWVTTKTALVSVTINAAVTDQGIEKIQSSVMQKLTQLSNQGEWHLVSFNRQLDKSGLESIQMMAQARLPQADLSQLRNKAKTLSKPGEAFSIDDIQFVPSEEELRQANLQLRNNLYQQAKTEIDTLNKWYADQKYYLYQMDFITAPVMPMPMAASARMSLMKVAAAPLSVGNKVELQATVVLASMPEVLAQKLHPRSLS